MEVGRDGMGRNREREKERVGERWTDIEKGRQNERGRGKHTEIGSGRPREAQSPRLN